MTLIKDADELDRLVLESEAIARGEQPDMAGTGGPAPAASEHGEGGFAPSSPSPASFSEVADFVMLLIQGGYLIAFGPKGVLPNDLSLEAKRNVELLCAKYLPSAVSSFGPETALVGILAVHTFNCYRQCQTTAPSPGSSANAEAGNQP